MKKFKTIYLALTFILFTVTGFSQITTTNNLQNLTTADGLVSNEVRDVFIQDNSNVWLSTDSGLSHYDGAIFTNYSITNSLINSNNLFELEYCQNKIWMISDSGLSSFDGTVFQNYTTTNGLLTNSILGLAATSTDTLWIASNNGSSKFDGSIFTDYTSQGGRDIETDSLDRVYVLRINGANNFPFARLYENGTWSLPSPTGINFAIGQGKLVKTASNKIYVAGSSVAPSRFIRIDYPLNCKVQTVYTNNLPHNGNISSSNIKYDQFEELNGFRWFGGANGVELYHASADSNYKKQYVNKRFAISSVVKANKTMLVIGSDSGIYITKPTLKKARNEVEFDINSIRTSVSITDPLFSNLNTRGANFEFPKGSNSHGLYSANFIVAAKKSSHSNFEVYPVDGFQEAFVPGPINTSGGLDRDYIVKVSKSEIQTHKLSYSQPGYTMPYGIIEWPAVGDSTLGIAKDLAPFFDENSNGCYDPQNGDYPIINGDEAIYWINHPVNPNSELEYHWMMYGFNRPSNKNLDQSIFVQYTIVNRAHIAYDSLKVGLYVDGDLGNAVDDYVGSDSLNNILYFYNGDSFDESTGGNNGYGKTSPALGVKFLSDSMENLMYYNSGTGGNGDPQTAQHWLGYMNSTWKNGRHVKYGGDGFDINSQAVSNINTTHMFTGNPVALTGWSELNPGGGLPRNAQGDRRLFGSIPYFSLQPNERKTIEVVVGYGRTSDTSAIVGKNIAEMKSVLNSVGQVWDTLTIPLATFGTNDSCIEPTSLAEHRRAFESKISVFPVPSSGYLTVLSENLIQTIEVYGIRGSLVMSTTPNSKRVILNLNGRTEGFYLLRIQNQDNSWEFKKIIVSE